MRVLTFLHSFEPGGVERVALRLIRQWRATGIDAPLFLGRTDGPMRQDVGENLAFETPPHIPAGVARWETLWMILQLPGVVRRIQPDILFCAGNTYAVVAVALKLLMGSACPPIIAKISNDLHRADAPWWKRIPYHWWLRIQGRFLDHVVGMAAPMDKDIRTLLGIPDERISVVPNPVLSNSLIERIRANHISAQPRNSHGRRFVAVGRLAPQKNLSLMLRAFATGARAGDTLTIIGGGQEQTKLRKLAHTLGIVEAVDFRGYVPEPAKHMHEFDILLLSSDYEGVPAVILEALAACMPIIATDCCSSMATLLKNGKLGTLVAVGDEAGFASAIDQARPNSQSPELSLLQARLFTIERSARRYIRIMSRMRPAASA